MGRKLLIIACFLIATLCLVSCNTIVGKGINKIGIISVWSDLENHQYAYKDEVFTTDKRTIKDIITAVNNGDVDKSVKLDRLPAEYEIQIYYDEEILKCYYWYQEPKYNFNISGMDGEMTIDGNRMDELIELITGETDREKIVDPY